MGELSGRGATIVQIVDSVNYVQMPRAAAERFYRQRRSRSGLARADEDLAGNLARLLPGGHGVAGLLGEDHLQRARLVLDHAAVLAREAEREHPCASRWARSTPSNRAPMRASAARERSLRTSVWKHTRRTPQLSNAWVSIRSLASVLAAVRMASAASQV